MEGLSRHVLERSTNESGASLSAPHYRDDAIRQPFVACVAEGGVGSGSGANCRHDSAAFFHITASFFIPSSSHSAAILRRSSTSVGRSMADWFSSDNSVIFSIVLTARLASTSASAVKTSAVTLVAFSVGDVILFVGSRVAFVQRDCASRFNGSLSIVASTWSWRSLPELGRGRVEIHHSVTVCCMNSCETPFSLAP